MNSNGFTLDWHDLSLWRGDRCLQTGLTGSIAAGCAVTVRGPNGCGKTTLLRTLCGLSYPETGEIRWCGERIERDRPGFYSQLAYSGHSSGLKSELSPRENLRFAGRLRGRNGDPDRLLAGLGLSRCADLPVRNLSAGQRRRAALALVLDSGAALWVLDEPFTNLDAAGSEWLGERLNAHVHEGGLLLLAAHQGSRIDPNREQLLELTGGAT